MITANEVEALLKHLETCRAEIEVISRAIDVMERYHNPEKLSWAVVGDFANLANLLAKARAFITSGGGYPHE